MEGALVVFVIVVVIVAIDAIGRLDERHAKRRGKHSPTSDSTITTSQKIVVDLTRRD
jgi:hypothetical protein